ncbi:SDR family NAD(P)-dependent oxidoreductase [Microbacterium sp. CFH 90308]|uniref:SDR family NAD(P)-dependent oxidoreductase n=1 Tax=Microbacterium salsuginis TaxID=2722803 RepID=A0ABX1KCG5_9MICO|nr:SDR family NAD(P)-dependent oxidoreductase [Microbacterium sp. CFH 90308]NLP84202.1 SDR family NAD(P)-dependent oxidoreductase [Microbacterium sp. CFH 90308]
MHNTLNDHVALVTGASSGIGRAIALALSRAGAKVVVGARRAERLDALVAEAPGEMLAVTLDVTDPDSATAAVAAAVERFGRLDSLVNNAGLMLAGPVVGADITEWVRMIETNLLGSMYAAHAALPHLIESRGAIVQVSSTSGRIASAGNAAYAASKFGINAFSEALRQEVTARGVRVTVIEPGFVATELTSHITDPVMREMAAGIQQSMRTLTADDIANVVVFALGQPDHVAVNQILVRPADQVQ